MIMVLMVIVMLTMLGLTVMQSTTLDMEISGAERGADRALYIAEAGIQWGLNELEFTYEEGNQGALRMEALRMLPAVSSLKRATNSIGASSIRVFSGSPPPM